MKNVEAVWPPTDVWEEGYKVFRKFPNEEYGGVYYGRNSGATDDPFETYRKGTTYYTTGCLHSMPWYTRAFHIFSNLESAQAYAQAFHINPGPYAICKVAYSAVTARGQQTFGFATYSAVSALEMRIIEELE
jgi:hypothetical protein